VTPEARNRARPLPATRGFGSSTATTTEATPAGQGAPLGGFAVGAAVFILFAAVVRTGVYHDPVNKEQALRTTYRYYHRRSDHKKRRSGTVVGNSEAVGMELYREYLVPFEVASLFLLVATGFLTLAGTGKMDALSLLLISAVLLARGVLLARDRKPHLPATWTTYATLAYAACYPLDFFLLSASFVRATVHLVLFVLAVKLFSAQRDRDYFYLAVISFGMVLIAAVLTVDSTFLFEFCLFLLLATATFISMEMRRSARAAPMRAHEFPAAKKAVSRSLSLTALLLVVATAAGAALLFFTLPRVSGGYLNQLAEGNQFVTGFGNDVQLGRIGEIKQSSAIVMHIRIQNGQNVLLDGHLPEDGGLLSQVPDSGARALIHRGTGQVDAVQRTHIAEALDQPTHLDLSDLERVAMVAARRQPRAHHPQHGPLGSAVTETAANPD